MGIPWHPTGRFTEEHHWKIHLKVHLDANLDALLCLVPISTYSNRKWAAPPGNRDSRACMAMFGTSNSMAQMCCALSSTCGICDCGDPGTFFWLENVGKWNLRNPRDVGPCSNYPHLSIAIEDLPEVLNIFHHLNHLRFPRMIRHISCDPAGAVEPPSWCACGRAAASAARPVPVPGFVPCSWHRRGPEPGAPCPCCTDTPGPMGQWAMGGLTKLGLGTKIGSDN